MGFHSRKQLSSQQRSFVDAPLPWGKLVVDAVPYPPDPLAVDRQKIEPFSSYTVYFFLVGGVTLLLCLLAIILFSKRRNARRTRSSPIFFGAQEDYLGEDEGPEIEHPIWYINTVGLHQVLIDSITVFKYMKDERLAEGTECSVCLSEFQEDESLRLLPKCSHAFHLPCIDTWLSSHKNCPLCRAPIVCDSFYAQIVLPELNLSSTDSTSREEPQMGNLVNHGGLIINYQVGEDGTSEVRDEDDMVRVSPIGDQAHPANPDMNLTESVLRNDSEVQGDLFNNNSREAEVEIVPVRRSLSLDDSSASPIYNVLANAAPEKEGNSDSLLVLQKSLRSKNVTKRGGSGTVSIGKLMRSSSLQKGPISMKRSLSSSWKRSSSSRHNRSKSSIHSI